MKTVALGDFLTDTEIAEVVQLYKTSAPGTFARTVEQAVIRPNLARINTALGQENDSKYLAYAIEYILMRVVIDK